MSGSGSVLLLALTTTATEATTASGAFTLVFSVGVSVIVLTVTTEATAGTTTATTVTTATTTATATTAATASTVTFFALRAAFEVFFLFGLALSVGDDVFSEEEVLAHEGDTFVVEEPVEVAPSELFLEEALGLELLHEVHDLDGGDFDLLATEGSAPLAEGVLLASDDTFGEEEAVDAVTAGLRDVSGHLCFFTTKLYLLF